MQVIRRGGWEIPERLATPEHLFVDRRSFLAAAATVALSPAAAVAQRVTDLPDPTKDLYPAKRNEKYSLDRPITDEKINTSYNNFYEFGSSKNIGKAAQALKLRPWTIKIDGMVDKAREIGLDDLIRKMPLEERLYRHRCVEAWSMAIPWSGFPLAKLLDLAQPLSSAKYLRMETFLDPRLRPDSARPGIRGPTSRVSPLRKQAMTSLFSSPALTASRYQSRRVHRCASRCPGNTVSSRLNRLCASISRISGRKATGRRCRRSNTGSGRT